MTRRVVCLGDVMVDVLARLPSPLATGSDTPAPISLLSGGSAANTAAWLVAAGVRTAFVGRVGDDALGRMVLDELAQLGLDLEVSVDPDRPTGACIVLVDGGGERTMVPSAGANAGLGEAGFRADLLGAGDHLHVSAYAVFQDGPRSAADAAVAAARAAAASVSVDAASAAPLQSFGADRFLAWLPRGLVLANRDEAAVLTGTDDPERAARVLAVRCGEAIVKCGAQGAVWSDGRTARSCAAETHAVVDSTGAGDAFAAGVLAARLQGQDVGWCLMAGNRLAAQAIATVGARPPVSR